MERSVPSNFLLNVSDVLIYLICLSRGRFVMLISLGLTRCQTACKCVVLRKRYYFVDSQLGGNNTKIIKEIALIDDRQGDAV